MIRIRLDDGEVTAAFGRAAAAMGDLTPLMQGVGEYLVAATQARLKSGKAPDGSAWAPRSQATLDAYARRKVTPQGGPLFTSAVLEQTIVMQAGPASVEVGSNQVYAATMQFGAAQGAFGARMGRTRPSAKRPKGQDYFFPIPWGDIPARPFLGLSEGDREAILEMAVEFLDGALRPGP